MFLLYVFLCKLSNLTIQELQIGQKATILEISNPEWENTLMELGFMPGRDLEILFKAPFGGPLAVQIGETLLSMRRNEASAVLVQIKS